MCTLQDRRCFTSERIPEQEDYSEFGLRFLFCVATHTSFRGLFPRQSAATNVGVQGESCKTPSTSSFYFLVPGLFDEILEGERYHCLLRSFTGSLTCCKAYTSVRHERLILCERSSGLHGRALAQCRLHPSTLIPTPMRGRGSVRDITVAHLAQFLGVPPSTHKALRLIIWWSAAEGNRFDV